MNNGSGPVLIAVAHSSEEGAVRRATEAARFPCEIIVTGVGGAAMSWALQKRFSEGGLHGGHRPGSIPKGAQSAAFADGTTAAALHGDNTPQVLPGYNSPLALPSLVIGAGIAGSYSPAIPPGTVVTTSSDCFADMGVDDNGGFRSVYGAGLADPDAPPFTVGRIVCSGSWFDIAAGILPPVTGATVNMTSGSQPVIDRIREAWNPDIETMEGAWIAYLCAMAGIPWIAVRAVSNMVEPRNRDKWDIPFALRSLEEKMTQLFELTTRPAGSGEGR